MSANVESMFYAGREKPWHGLGTQVEEAPTSADALRLAGLDWTVQRKPIQVCGGRKVDNFFANVRSSDGAVLGVVSDRYQVVQNAEAFAFTDALIGGEGQVHYERDERHGWTYRSPPHDLQLPGEQLGPNHGWPCHDGQDGLSAGRRWRTIRTERDGMEKSIPSLFFG